MKSVHEGNKAKCDICGKDFSQISAVYLHQRNVHKIDNKPKNLTNNDDWLFAPLSVIYVPMWQRFCLIFLSKECAWKDLSTFKKISQTKRIYDFQIILIKLVCYNFICFRFLNYEWR